MPEAAFHPDRLLRALQENEVEFVLIGGLAAVIHGANYATFDADVCPAEDRENLDRLSAALRSLGARIRVDGIEGGLPFDHDGESLSRATVWNLVTDAGDLDVAFRPAGTHGYTDLITDAVEVDLWNARIRVASLSDVVRSKRAADRPKDRMALPVLERLLQERAEGG